MERRYVVVAETANSTERDLVDQQTYSPEIDHRREKRNRIIGMLALYSSIAAGAIIANKVYRYFQPRH